MSSKVEDKRKDLDGQNNNAKKRKIIAPTVQDILQDELTRISLENWATFGSEKTQNLKPFSAQLVSDIYHKDLQKFDPHKLMILEFSHYLENYLWKNFNAKTSDVAHIMSIVLMINEKIREGAPAWDCFRENEQLFGTFFDKLLTLKSSHKLSLRENVHFLAFLVSCFQSLEEPILRKNCLKLVSINLWKSVNPARVSKEVKSLSKLSKLWETTKQKKTESDHEVSFLPQLLEEFFTILDSLKKGQNLGDDELLKIKYCDRFMELILDLLSQIPTRRFLHLLLDDLHFIVKCDAAEINEIEEATLFSQLLEMVKFYYGFEINNYTGESLNEEQTASIQAIKIQELQNIAFKHFPKLKELALANISALGNREVLQKYLAELPVESLRSLAEKLCLVPEKSKNPEPKKLLTEIIVSTFQKRTHQLSTINQMPMYPNEELMWDPLVIPSDEYNGEHCLALPKLNLQFLSFYDYLLRNFDLFRLESAYEIRNDLEDVIQRMTARKDSDSGQTKFQGWSRMALPIKEFSLTKVGKPKVGNNNPSIVLGSLKYSLQSFSGRVRDEWDEIKAHDVLFLVTIEPLLTDDNMMSPEEEEEFRKKPFLEQYGVKFIRGCEVVEVFDEAGKPIKENDAEPSPKVGNIRTVTVSLDTAQYYQDGQHTERDVYSSFNLVVRRKSKENNFRAVLDTILELLNSKAALPDWLNDMFLGYGAKQDKKQGTEDIHFQDTFVSVDHLLSIYPNNVTFMSGNGKPLTTAQATSLAPNSFRLKIEKGDHITAIVSQANPLKMPLVSEPKRNAVPFTSKQVQAVKSAMLDGLTMIVGPPGTGKTDVAVQIISNLYHNFPEQRIVFVAHSNQAVNQLFEKIMHLDIAERYLLRLGHGQELLNTSKDFSRYGRVNYLLERRLELLQIVQQFAKSIGSPEDVAYTCETAENFFKYSVHPKWSSFMSKFALQEKTSTMVTENFPFSKFFLDNLKVQKLFEEKSTEDDLVKAKEYFNYLVSLEKEIHECRAMELLTTPKERANHILTKHARIIAMTCTHAALKRSEFISLGFKYDNLIMEEAAQILEIETLIPMLLQSPEANEKSRLKRVVLIGDHHQLPPIVKNMAFQKYSRFDQSLFARFVRLGIPTIELDAQGRARPNLSKLFNWRYKNLQDLGTVVTKDFFKKANPGFALDYQIINVDDLQGKGETQPTSYYYQNVSEAEYVVAMFMYMRLLGYPAEKISILTTYKGQKALLKDVLKARTSWTQFYGSPKITTVDRYQGEQNDYILLSLVRTKAVGHLRDIRRLVVAMSRARLGLYVFCKQALFQNCYELTPTFVQFMKRPNKLQIVEGETYPTSRTLEEKPKATKEINSVMELGGEIAKLQTTVIPAFVKQQQELQKKQEEEYQRQQKEVAEVIAKQQEQQKEQQLKAKPVSTNNKDKEEEEEEEMES